MSLRLIQKPLELIALIFGAINFGTAYYLLFLSQPTWVAVPFDAFLPVFKAAILNIGGSQIIVSNIALVSCLILFYLSRDWFWLLAVAMLLVSLPITIYWMMPINLHFLEAVEPAVNTDVSQKLKDWGNYQILRFLADGVAFAAMCKPIIWRKPNKG